MFSQVAVSPPCPVAYLQEQSEAGNRALGPFEEFRLRSTIEEIRRLAESLVDAPGLISRQRNYIFDLVAWSSRFTIKTEQPMTPEQPVEVCGKHVVKKITKAVQRRDDPRCRYCRSRGSTIDHVIPKIQGGPDHPDNYLLSCTRCNSSKGGRDPWQWAADILAAAEPFREYAATLSQQQPAQGGEA